MFAILAACVAVHAFVVLSVLHELTVAPLLIALALVHGLVLALALAGLTSLRPPIATTLIALSAMLGLVRGEGAEPPVGEAVGLSGIVLEVEPEGSGARVLLAEPEVTADGEVFALARPIRVTFDWLVPLPETGSALTFDARLARARVAMNPTTTPRERAPFYATALTVPRDVPDAARRTPSWATSVALDLRRHLTFESASATALYRALLLGDRSELDAETRYAYQDTGTAHLLAISGMNLALLGWGLFRLLMLVVVRAGRVPLVRHLGFERLAQGHRPRVVAALVAFAATAAYTALIAPSDATDRALAALALTFGGIVLFRSADAGRALIICLLGAAVIAPEVLLHAGFQLSFAATASLVLIAPHVARVRGYLAERIGNRGLRSLLLFVIALVLADIACFLATAPLTVAWFGQLPVHGLWVNLVAIPFMSFVVFPAGVLWLVLATLVPPLAEFVAPALAALGDAFNDFIRVAGDVSGSASTEAWPLALGVLACLCLLALMSLRRIPMRAGAVGLAAASLLAFAAESPRAGLTLIALDVGHGDALALRLPDGTRVLFDTGGRATYGAPAPSPAPTPVPTPSRDPNRQLAERTLVPALRAIGFSTIDLLVLTHSDLDHVGAASALAERIPIRHLWLPPCSRTSTVEALATRLAASGTQLHAVAAAATFDYGGAIFELLSPRSDVEHDGECTLHDNDASLVARVSYAGRSILLTGDIEAPTERDLVARVPNHLRADVLKVPHHGSRTSSTEAFLDAVSPSAAIISGASRKRPPPHPTILERYRTRSIDNWLTGTSGAISAHIDPTGELLILTEVTPP